MKQRDDSAVDRYVGSRIRMRRMALRLSQHAMAPQVGMSLRELQDYERGITRLNAAKVFEIAAFLSVPVSSFFDGMPLAGEGKPLVASWLDFERMIATEEGEVLVGLFPKLTDADRRRAVVEIVRVMVGDT
jgi:transcriptional regulator with XRE-family HTH domain